MYYSEPVVVNHGVLFSASGGESWCDMVSPVVVIVMYYAEQVVVNNDVLC
jgi:hypothetical protein